MTNEGITTILKKSFHGGKLISTNKLMTELRKIFPNSLDSTLAWRLSALKKNGLIQQVGRGQYTFNIKPEFEPKITFTNKRLINRIKDYCSNAPVIWETCMVDTLIDRVSSLNWIFIEIDRQELDIVCDQSLEFSRKVFANPDKETILRYIRSIDDAIILIPKVSETPTLRFGDFTTLSIEGLLVNLYWYQDKYFSSDVYDIEVIYKNAFQLYKVNTSKLLRFAARRDRKKEIELLIKRIST